jgi:hypothetical protein
MKAEELIGLQVRLEYQGEGKRLYPFSGSTEQARFIIYRYEGGFMRFYQNGLPESLRQELEETAGERVFQEPEAVRAVLNAYRLCESLGIYASCCFDCFPEPGNYPDARQEKAVFD